MGSLAVIGVGINANNVGSLSKDQDSICTAVGVYTFISISSTCFDLLFSFENIQNILIPSQYFQVKTLGAIDVSSASTTDTTTGTELNALITAIEAVSTPSC